MEDKNIAKYLQLIQSAWAESHASTTIFQYRNIVVLARLSAHTDLISSMHLAQHPRLPFFVLFYKQLIILWCCLTFNQKMTGSKSLENLSDLLKVPLDNNTSTIQNDVP